MKVTNWRKKIAVAIAAAGIWIPGVARAVSIPLADPSFDAYTVPAAGYAYANSYRPTSGWVDDLDHTAAPYVQDNVDSNWLYNAAYAEDGPPFRGAPRTGNQAMHGIAHYSAQETSSLFAAEKIYTFSIWAQGDNDAITADNSVYLYLFNGSVPLNETGPGTVKFQFFQGGPGGAFANRGPGMTQAQSKANWTKLTITHTVFPGAAEINQPVGVAFYATRDAAVDDATLDVVDASTQLLVMEVNTTNGQVRVRNQTGGAVSLDYYDVKSSAGALNAVAWNSLQEQNLAGYPAGNGSGNGWEQAGGSNSNAIGESYLTGSSSIATSGNVGLGAAFNVGGAQDLVFQYGALSSAVAHPTGDYNDNGVVDAADYVLWRDKLGQNVVLPNDSTSGSVTQADYDIWRQHFGEASSAAPSLLRRGLVHYVTSFSGLGSGAAVPEPSSVILVGLGIFSLVGTRRARSPQK